MNRREFLFGSRGREASSALSSAEKAIVCIEEFRKLEPGLREVAQIAKSYFKKGVTGTEKRDFQDIVTEADPVLEDKITQVIKSSYPDAKVWGEEKGGNFTPDSWGIDPLDGTAVFRRGGRDWCNALVRMESGRPVFSAIIVPIGNKGTEVYVAKEGQGAFVKEYLLIGGERVKRIETAKTSDLKRAPFGMRQEDVWNSVKEDATEEDRDIAQRIHKLSASTSGTNISGSTSYVMASVAAGRFSVACAGPQALWDVAMGDILVREAGGVVTQLNGEPIDYMKGGLTHKTSWLASANERVHEEALRVLDLKARI